MTFTNKQPTTQTKKKKTTVHFYKVAIDTNKQTSHNSDCCLFVCLCEFVQSKKMTVHFYKEAIDICQQLTHTNKQPTTQTKKTTKGRLCPANNSHKQADKQTAENSDEEREDD